MKRAAKTTRNRLTARIGACAAVLLFAVPIAAAVDSVTPIADVALLREFVQPMVVVDFADLPEQHCVIDTGSGVGVLHSKLTVKAGRVGLRNITVANGKVAMPVVEMRSVAIGAAKVSFVEFLQRDQSWFAADEPLPCIIGINFLAHFTVDLDGSSGRMRLFPRGTKIDSILGTPTPPEVHLAAKIWQSGLIRVETRIGDVRAQSQIDTGWGYGSANSALLNALGLDKDGRSVITRSWTNRDSGRTHSIQMMEINDVRIGALHIDKTEIVVSDTTLSVIRKPFEPYLQIGWGLIGKHRLLIDFTHADVALVP